jgi:hypothetical protein
VIWILSIVVAIEWGRVLRFRRGVGGVDKQLAATAAG